MGPQPDRIDPGAASFVPFVPSYKLEPGERQKFFSENKTSIIDYPKGIPNIEKYLVSMKFDKDPADMLTAHYREVSKAMGEVAEYIKKESLSNDQYRGNILTLNLSEQ